MRSQHGATEATGLLLLSIEPPHAEPLRRHHQGQATQQETIINLMKTCMGTGTLALPFAASQGGLYLNTIGLILIAAWNLYSVQRLCHCLTLIPKDIEPPKRATTFAKVAWFAFGDVGLHALDGMMIILLCGIIVAYEDAIMSFVEETPFSTGSKALDALATVLIMGPLSVVPDMGYLSKASALGLLVLGVTFGVIAAFGDVQGVFHGWSMQPQYGLSGVSHWFGCVVFGFGVVPLTYNFQESMAEPHAMVSATGVALLNVALAYIVIGSGLVLMYPDVEGDILQNLPMTGVLPMLVRIAMVLVVLVTAPLLIVPCGELIEEKVAADGTASTQLRAIVRLGVCFLCTIISVSVPGFVYVLSFVGCCFVALVGFVIPPLLHLVLTRGGQGTNRYCFLLDCGMLLWGLTATIISSVYTFKLAVHQQV